MSFAVVIEGMTLITFIVILAGGKQKRETGWKVLSALLVLVGLIQCAGMTLIVRLLILLRACHFLYPTFALIELGAIED